MDIIEIRDNYNNGHYTCNMEIPARVKENYVFDENLSVKRNREMVAEHNQKVEDMKREKQDKQAELYRQLTDGVVAYIVDSYNISEEQARIVEGFVYMENIPSCAIIFLGLMKLQVWLKRLLKQEC